MCEYGRVPGGQLILSSDVLSYCLLDTQNITVERQRLTSYIYARIIIPGSQIRTQFTKTFF